MTCHNYGMRSLLVVLLLASPAFADKKPVKKPMKYDLTDKPIVLRQEAPKPQVVVVSHDGKNVTGRPKSGDRLTGLDHHLR